MSQATDPQRIQAILSCQRSAGTGWVFSPAESTTFCGPDCGVQPRNPPFALYSSVADALQAGLNPCAHCQDSAQLQPLIAVARCIEAHADERLPLTRLAPLAGLSATQLQKRFKAAFGLSPKAYQDAVRLRLLKRGLKTAESVTEAIYDAGFGSGSRVYGESQRLLGMTPASYRRGAAGEQISYACCRTSIGLLMLAATDRGVCFAFFGEDEATLLTQLQDEFPQAQLWASPAQHQPLLQDWLSALQDYLDHGAPHPAIPLDLRGTAFQMQVWQFLGRIPVGQVISYTALAEGIGQPAAVRAAASACGKNRVGLLIPCHRVLRGDGSLGGYRWGLERKQALLAMERRRSE